MNYTENDITIVEGTARSWQIALQNTSGEPLPMENYTIYGAAAAPGEITRIFTNTADPITGQTITTMPGLPITDEPWRYQILARERSSGVEWLLAAGSVYLIARLAAPLHAVDPGMQALTATLSKDTIITHITIGENMASISQNTRKAIDMAAAAESSSAATRAQALDAAAWAARANTANTNASTSASNAAQSAQDAQAAATASGTQAAATSAQAASQSAQAAASSATTASQKAENAATSAAVAAAKAQITIDHSQASLENAERAEERAVEAAASAQDAQTAAGAAQDAQAAAGEKALESATHAAEARRAREGMQEDHAAMLEHLDDEAHHITIQEKNELHRLMATFPAVDPDTPWPTPSPVLPDTALHHNTVAEYFSTHAQPGVSQAPSAVYVSRVPWARKDPATGQWQNNASAVNEEVFHATRKFMDNAGLVHRCSTDTSLGQDDYNGKLWPFFCNHGNYTTDAYGIKHLTAIKGQVIQGASYETSQPVGAFGPAFYFFCCLERYQDPETGNWTTHDGTAEGTPLFQLWGISARAWDDLDQGRQDELTAHGVTAADFHLWPECYTWDPDEQKLVPRPYWLHSAYCGGYERDEAEAVHFVSKPNMPLWYNLCYNTLQDKYAWKPGHGGSACVQGFGMLFDIVKNATKNSQSIHAGMHSNNNNAVAASLNTAVPDYVFPVASQGNFRVGCTVWLNRSSYSSSNAPMARSLSVQIGRIKAIENRTLLLQDGTEATALCLVMDPSTIQPFVTRTTATDAAAYADGYAHCHATQGMAMSGETDTVLGIHDGSRTSYSDGKHPYRVQMTEYMAGCYICAADVLAVKGNGTTDVEIDGQVVIPTSSQYIIFQAGQRAARRNSGTVAQFLAGGYKAVGVTPVATGYILNVQLSSTGVAYPVAAAGTGSSDSTGHGDQLYSSAAIAEFLCGGYLNYGAAAGSACLSLNLGPGNANWTISARD